MESVNSGEQRIFFNDVLVGKALYFSGDGRSIAYLLQIDREVIKTPVAYASWYNKDKKLYLIVCDFNKMSKTLADLFDINRSDIGFQ